MRELKKKLKLLIVFTILLITGIFFATSYLSFKTKQTIVVGAKNCTEQYILAEMISQLIEKETNLKVIRRFNLEGTTICFNALKSKTIDVYFEYTGTALLHILKEPLRNEALYPYLKEAFEKKYGIIWCDRLGFVNQYALIARKNSHIKKISDINQQTPFAIDAEFMSREEFKLLKIAYEKKWEPKLLDQVLLYFSLKSGTVDVISGFSTDGRLYGDDFILLEDDARILPGYEVAPIINKKCLRKHPELKRVFSTLGDRISGEEMRRLNYLVEFENKNVRKLIRNFTENSLKDKIRH